MTFSLMSYTMTLSLINNTAEYWVKKMEPISAIIANPPCKTQGDGSFVLFFSPA
jgi:hypothetical protein